MASRLLQHQYPDSASSRHLKGLKPRSLAGNARDAARMQSSSMGGDNKRIVPRQEDLLHVSGTSCS